MTTRTDVLVDYNPSPRIAEVEAPSTEMTMQDLVDTLRISEEGFHEGLAFAKLVNASGKEDLGGGTSVGITVSLQNTKLSFEARTTPAQTGTVTTGSAAPVSGTISFEDTSATFVTNGVGRGSLVINFTDQSIADVVEVIDETHLKTKTLVNGSDNSFDFGDSYQVFNVVQCTANGGNLVAVDSTGNTVSPILPTAFTQVILTNSASATLQELTTIQYSAFGGGVHVSASGTSGTTFPTGTPQQPVNNLTDALTIAVARGLEEIHIADASFTIDTGLDYTGFRFVGNGETRTSLTLSTAAILDDCSFIGAMLSGTVDTNIAIKECILNTMTFSDDTEVNDSLIYGPITLAGSSTNYVNFVNCDSQHVGQTLSPTIDCGGAAGPSLAFRKYSGGITLSNKSGGGNVAIDLASGFITLSTDITGGEITLRGVGKLTDNSSTGATVYNDLLDTGKYALIQKILTNRSETNPNTGIMTVYDDDDTTPLLTANIFEDVAGGTAYNTGSRKIDRRNRFST